MGHFFRGRIRVVLLLASSLVFSIACPSFAADEVEAVQGLLNRIDQAWAAHDLAALGQCLSDQGFLGVQTGPGATAEPWVGDKKTALAMVGKAWTDIKSHRFVERRIGISMGTAAVQATTVVEFVSGERREGRLWYFAVKEGGQWRMCFSIPDIASLVVLVDGLESSSSAARAGLRKGDVILHCDGRLVSDASFYGWTTPPGQRTIGVRRGTAELEIKTQGGPLGVKPWFHWRPAEGSEVVRAHQPHPIKDRWVEWYRASVADDRARVAALGCPAGMLQIWPASRDAAKVLCGDAVHASFQENWKAAAKQYDLTASTLKDISLIQRDGIALGTCFMDWKSRADGSRSISGPVETNVFVKQGDSWHWLAALPMNYIAAIGLPDDPAGGSVGPATRESSAKHASVQTTGARRTWSDSTGKYRTEAQFFGLEDGKVRLKKSDGTVTAIPLDRLSEGDQEYVKKTTH